MKRKKKPALKALQDLLPLLFVLRVVKKPLILRTISARSMFLVSDHWFLSNGSWILLSRKERNPSMPSYRSSLTRRLTFFSLTLMKYSSSRKIRPRSKARWKVGERRVPLMSIGSERDVRLGGG